MSKLAGQILSESSFSWADGVKKDGTPRQAGTYRSVSIWEEGPTLASSSIVEIQIPDDQYATFAAFLKKEAIVPGSNISLHVEHTGRGKARLLAVDQTF